MGVYVRVAVAALALAAVQARAEEPYLTARAAIVLDAATGDIIWERNGWEPLPPASTTKIMTAILALESGRLGDQFQVSSAAAATAPSSINLRPGQRMMLRDLLYAVLLNSANDASEVVAEGLAGSVDRFGDQMTSRARELGARTARFHNPHGLTEAGHVASARDLAVIFRHGLGIPLLRDILGTRTIRVPVESSRVHWVSLRSHNRLLTGHGYPVIGKTGYTRAARRCFVGAATHDNREIIIALLGASDLWGDAKRLLAHGFGETDARPTVVMASILPVPKLNAREGDDEDDDEPAQVRRQRAAARYTVRLGPYASRRTASATRSRLAQRGYTAVLAGRTLRLGSFSSRSRAQRLATRLRRSGHRGVVVAL
jgi:D-alanyl-D-alanine carboxypeptidase (penicillin-binding protein 5/6)